MADVLPDTRARDAKGVIVQNGVEWVPLFCANCPASGGYATKDQLGDNFYFYLCEKCAESWGGMAATMVMPDQVFWKKVADSQMDAFGRVLTPEEQARGLLDPNHVLSKVAKDKGSFR